MKGRISALAFSFIAILFISGAAFAQRNVEPAIERDPILEIDALHNLDVARQAFGPARKAYKQVLLRFEETYAAYPSFSRMDEFLFLAGMSSYYLSDNKGKQKVNLKSEKEREKYDPKKLRENARAYLSTLVETYPESRFKEDAETTLEEIKEREK